MLKNRPKMPMGVSYSTIDADELLTKLMPLYPFARPQACRFWERGINDTYQLVCADSTYSLRVYRHGLRTRDAIEFEVAALNHLHQRGLNVAYPIARHDGGFVSELQAPEGLRYAMVTAYAHGSKPDYEDYDNAGRYGEAVARLHNLSDDFDTDYCRPRLELEYLLDTSLDVISPFLAAGSDDLKFLEKTAEELRHNVANVPAESLDTGFCHGDCHGHNVHNHNGILTHYDFDCCGQGLRVFDLATFRWGNFNNKDGEKLWHAFLTAYLAGREVSDAGLKLIDTFVAIRHIWWIALLCGNVKDFGYAHNGEQFVQKQTHNMKTFFEKTSGR